MQKQNDYTLHNNKILINSGYGISTYTELFKASHPGCFKKFKKSIGIHNVIRHGGAASSDQEAANM